MNNIAISVENVSKQYRLGDVGTGTLSHDLNRFWYKIRGKEDPYLSVGEANDRTQKGSSDYVWSLKNISFDIKKGDALGVLGRNGAGKSTLLKILSKTTTPTVGKIKIKGRLASLLEVGTGFNPELTGRENVFLNGAILGMRKNEIQKKFDQIVDFAGVERYIDTPVKRYSSGMYVRLAFGVAAHLESDILILDEVLAVGDTEFQKKCLNKMDEVLHQQGRTVLFVSHNINAIKQLCNKGIFLQNGELIYSGDIIETMKIYDDIIKLEQQKQRIASGEEIEIIGLDGGKTVVKVENKDKLKKIKTNYTNTINEPKKDVQITRVSVKDEFAVEKEKFDVWERVFIEIDLIINKIDIPKYSTPILNIKKDGLDIFSTFASDNDKQILETTWNLGIHKYRVELLSPLKKGIYDVTAKFDTLRFREIEVVYEAVQFQIIEDSFDPTYISYASVRNGIIPANLKWEKIN